MFVFIGNCRAVCDGLIGSRSLKQARNNCFQFLHVLSPKECVFLPEISKPESLIGPGNTIYKTSRNLYGVSIPHTQVTLGTEYLRLL